MGQDESSPQSQNNNNNENKKNINYFVSKFNCKLGDVGSQDQQYQTTKPNAHLQYYGQHQQQNRDRQQDLMYNQKKSYKNYQKNKNQNNIDHHNNNKQIYSIFQNQEERLQKNQNKHINLNLNKQDSLYLQHQNLIKISQTPFQNSQYNQTLKQYIEQKNLISLTQLIQQKIQQSQRNLKNKNKLNSLNVQIFNENDVKGLLQSLVYGLSFLQKRKCNHHNFYPSTIYKDINMNAIDNQEFVVYKIVNPLMGFPSSYFLTYNRKRFSFLSPELILAIIDQKTQEDLLKQCQKMGSSQFLSKSDIFAIGMILLQFCSLKPSAQCYDQQNYNILDSVIQQRLQEIRDLYNGNYNENGGFKNFGNILFECISLMLQYQVEKRIGIEELALFVWGKFNMKRQKNMINNSVQAPKMVPVGISNGQPIILPMNSNSSHLSYPPILASNIPLPPKVISSYPVLGQQGSHIPTQVLMAQLQQQQRQNPNPNINANTNINTNADIPKFRILQKIAMTPNGPVIVSQEMVPNQGAMGSADGRYSIPFNSQPNSNFSPPTNYNINVNRLSRPPPPNPFQQIDQNEQQQKLKKKSSFQTRNINPNTNSYNSQGSVKNSQYYNFPHKKAQSQYHQIYQPQFQNQLQKQFIIENDNRPVFHQYQNQSSLQGNSNNEEYFENGLNGGAKYAVSTSFNSNIYQQQPQQQQQQHKYQDSSYSSTYQNNNKVVKVKGYTGSNFTLGQKEVPNNIKSIGGLGNYSTTIQNQQYTSSYTYSPIKQEFESHDFLKDSKKRRQTLQERVQRVLNISKNIK